jgi:Tfp pilus assembly protein PilO
MNDPGLRRRFHVRALLWTERLAVPGLIGVVLALCAIVAFLVFDVPLWQQHRDLQRQVLAVNKNLRELAPTASTVAVLAPLTSPLGTEDELPTVLADIARLARDEGLSFPMSDYTWTPQTEAEFGQYELQFSLKGGYLPIRHFLQDLLNNEPALAIRNVSLSRDSPAQPDLNAKIRIVIFADGKKS